MCGKEVERTCNDGAYWYQGVCGMACIVEKEWRTALSILNKPYRSNPIHACISAKAIELGECLLVNDRLYHAFDHQQCGAGCRKDAKWMNPDDFRFGGKFYVKEEGQ
jgi:hypothetical protein